MSINQTEQRKVHDKARKWANAHKEQIYARAGNKCEKCEAEINLTIHHLKYEIGMEHVQVLCNRCHRAYHDLEMKKKMMIYCLGDFKRNNIPNSMTVGEYKKLLWDRIEAIPIEIVTGKGFGGVPDYLMEE